MSDDEENTSSAAKPLEGQQNTLSTQTAPGSTVQGQAPQQQQKQAGSVSTESGLIGASAAPAPTAQQTANKRSSGQFTNLQKFIQANKGNNLASNIQQNIQKQAEQTQGTLTKRAGEVQTGLQNEASRRTGTFGAEGQQGTAYTALSRVGQTGQQAGPTQEQLTQDEQALTQARDYKFQGPEKLETNDLLRASAEVGSKAKATGTEAGRFALLQDMFGRAGYTSGQQKLDNLILQSDKGNLDKLAEARQSARGLQANLQQTSVETANKIKQEKEAATTAVKDFATQLGTTSEALTTDLGNRIGQMNEQLGADFANFTEEEKSEILNKLGFGKNPRTGEFVIGDLTSVSPSELADIFTQVKNEASLTNFDEGALARANLLQRLRGQDELAQFNKEAKGPGIEYGLTEQGEGIKDFLPQNEASLANADRVQGTAAKRLADMGMTSATLDNYVYDTGAQESASYKRLTKPELYGMSAKPGEFTTAAKSEGAYQLLSPNQKAKFDQRIAEIDNMRPKTSVDVDRKRILIEQLNRDMTDSAASEAKKYKSSLTAENTAQANAIRNMASYLRDSANSFDRSAFETNLAPTSYSGGDYRLSNATRANRYYKG